MLNCDCIYKISFFFVTSEGAKYATVLYQTSIQEMAKDKHSSLLDPLLSYDENEVVVFFTIFLEMVFRSHSGKRGHSYKEVT